MLVAFGHPVTEAFGWSRQFVAVGRVGRKTTNDIT
jgi:hypothetical protein